MYESEKQACMETTSVAGSLIRGTGYLCILIGILVGGWVFFKIVAFFKDPASFLQFQALLTEPIEAVANLQDKDAKVIIPTEPLAYLLVVILFGIVVRIGGLFLSTGARLLTGDNRPNANKANRQSRTANQPGNVEMTIKNSGID